MILVSSKFHIYNYYKFSFKKKIEDYNSDLIPIYDQKTFEAAILELKTIKSIIKNLPKGSSFYQNQKRKETYLERNIEVYTDYIGIQENKQKKGKIN